VNSEGGATSLFKLVNRGGGLEGGAEKKSTRAWGGGGEGGTLGKSTITNHEKEIKKAFEVFAGIVQRKGIGRRERPS